MRPRPYRGSTKAMNVNELNSDEQFILHKCIGYLIRHLKRFTGFEKEALALICWILGENIDKLTDFFTRPGRKQYASIETDIHEADSDPDEYAEIFFSAYKKSKWEIKRQFRRHVLRLLGQYLAYMPPVKISGTEGVLKSLSEMFKLNQNDLELCTILFLTKTYDPPESYFDYHLECYKYKGRKFLLNILDLNASQLQKSLVKLKRLEIIRIDYSDFDLQSEVLEFLQNPDKPNLTRNFFVEAPGSKLPLGAHFIPEQRIAHIKKLLKKKRAIPTHLLFYGPPGTGKTSLARRLGSDLTLSTYEIAKDKDNESASQRSAITACINMTNTGKGSLIIVDEADNLINTSRPWMFGGETHDKGWLNHLLEIPGTRIIWITNSTRFMDASVLRRFSFSLCFKTLNQKQRMLLWERLLRLNKIKRHFNDGQIARLAAKYKLSAGSIDLAIKKALDSEPGSRAALVSAIELGIHAHLELINGGTKKLPEKQVDKTFTLEGLHVKHDLQFILSQAERFGDYLRHTEGDLKHQMTLLFYGPPGTGKSELARYFGAHLERKIIFKRFSDLQSKWVGDGEKNIRAAFEEAENEKAILVIDEIDSVLFSRDRAQKSWEISFTNEFLTAMERFRSLLICTTNRLKDLDNAAIRRFTYKVEFDFLTPGGCRIFFNQMLKPLTKASLTPVQERRLSRFADLAPGDFKTVQNKYAFYPDSELNNGLLIAALEEESRIKGLNASRKKIGF